MGGAGRIVRNFNHAIQLIMQLSVIKIGGNVIDDENKLSAFLNDFASLPGDKILVHGGGKVATEIGRKLGIEPNYVNGRRITDEATLLLVTMVYGGLINKKIVSTLQSLNCNAMGLTGADGRILPAAKRPIGETDYGFVGDIHSDDVNTTLLGSLLHLGLTPVIAPLTFDKAGTVLNTNADTIAQEIAKAMARGREVQLIYCFEKKGVLRDVHNDFSVISTIDHAAFSELKENNIISDGMLPKLENAFAAVDSGVKKVVIGHADELQALHSGHGGTSIV